MRHIEILLHNIHSSFDSYLANGHITGNKASAKGIEILSPASVLFTDIFVSTQFKDT